MKSAFGGTSRTPAPAMSAAVADDDDGARTLDEIRRLRGGFAATVTAPKREGSVTPLPDSVKGGGVVTGDALMDLLAHAKENKYAIPAVNVVSSCSIAACLEAA